MYFQLPLEEIFLFHCISSLNKRSKRNLELHQDFVSRYDKVGLQTYYIQCNDTIPIVACLKVMKGEHIWLTDYV